MLDSIKGKLTNIKEWVVEQVLWAEHSLIGKPGKDKKAAVVAKVDEMIKLPIWLEWADGPIISILVDKACDLLNKKEGHDWKNVNETDKNVVSQLAGMLPDPMNKGKGGM